MGSFTRRRFLRTGLAGGAFVLAPSLRAGPSAPSQAGAEPGRARNVIFLVSDGMSLGTLSCGPDTLEQYRLTDREYRFSFRLKVEE